MIGRALGVSLRQALRSAALTFFPLTFISLFAWATAGSTSGNTTDPIRASAWLWLGAHLIPFSLSTGKLSILPLLAVLLPIFALRRSFPKVEEGFAKLNGARLFFALWYSLIALAMALASSNHNVKANIYLAPVFAFVIAIASTLKFRVQKFRHFSFAVYCFCILMGVGALVFALSLAAHWSVLKSIGIVIAPGLLGGFLFLAIQLLYLPNIAVMTVSYLMGSGFSFGAHSKITADTFTLNQIPAIPIVSGLPTGRHPILSYGIIAMVIVFILYFIEVIRSESGFRARQVRGIGDAFRFLLFLALLSYLSGGELLTPALNPVGVPLLKFISYIGSALAASALVVLYLPDLIKRVAKRG
jgi:hypothetical protein